VPERSPGLRWAIVAALFVAGVARAQTVRVTGSVVAENIGGPVANAEVRLTGGDAVVTDANGRFQLSTVPGRYVLTVMAVGFRLRSLDLDISRDTSLTIVMPRLVVTLDTMVVRAANVRILGAVVDSATGSNLMQAKATIYPSGKSTGALSGEFLFTNVPAGEITIVVEAAEHLPAQATFRTFSDTLVVFRLGIDSVALRMIALQVKRLESRTKAMSVPSEALNRDAIVRQSTTTIGELIYRRLNEDPVDVRRRPPVAADEGCFFLDDAKVPREAFEGVLAELVERVEFYKEAGQSASIRPRVAGRTAPTARGGVRMIRVYTKRYAATLARQEELPRIVYMPGTRISCS
jgi:hypothetical protein